MPIFRCPQCGREGYIPMAACDEVLHKIPYDEKSNKHALVCVDCDAGRPAQPGPVQWEPPNCRLVDE